MRKKTDRILSRYINRRHGPKFILVAMCLLVTVFFQMSQIALASGVNKWASLLQVSNSYSSHNNVIVPTSDGKYIIVWAQEVSWDDDLYAMKIENLGSSGQNVWGAPVQLTNLSGSEPDQEGGLSVVADGSGGAYIAYRRNGPDVYVQHIDSSGAIWQMNGEKMYYDSTVENWETQPSLLYDSTSGGVYVAWHDAQSFGSFNNYVYLSRLGSSGSVHANWNTGDGDPNHTYRPVRVGTSDNAERPFLIDNAADLPLVTTMNLDATRSVTAFRYSATGAPSWGPTTITDANNMYNNSDTYIAVPDDNDGIYLAYESLTDEVHAVQISNSGAVGWNSTVFTPGAEEQLDSASYIHGINDGDGNFMVVWGVQSTSDFSYDLFTQKVNSSGSALWNEGTPYQVFDDPSKGNRMLKDNNYSIVSDGQQGLIVAAYKFSQNKVNLQHLLSDSTRDYGDWNYVMPYSSYYHSIAPDGQGGAIISYNISRIYAQRYNNPAPAAPFSLTADYQAGGGVHLEWAGSYSPPATFRIYRSTSQGGPYAFLDDSATDTYDDLTAEGGIPYYYVVRAYRGGEESTNSNEASIILTAPASPQNVGGESGNQTTHIYWDASTGADNYDVYRCETAVCDYPLDLVRIAEGVADLFYNDSALSNGTEYTYSVKAANLYGDSEYSASVDLMPTAGGPSPSISYTIENFTWIGATNVNIEIFGQNLDNAISVNVGGENCSISVNQTDYITCQLANVPAIAGNSSLNLFTPNGPVSVSFYIYGPPSVSDMTPVSGFSTGGTPVTIYGSGFGWNTVVEFNGNPANVVDIFTDAIEVETPAGTAGQTVPVIVTNPGNQTASAGNFTYVAAPVPPGEWWKHGITGDGLIISDYPDGDVPYQFDPQAIRTSDGHYLSVWVDDREDSTSHLYAKKINETDGSSFAGWPDNGLAVTSFNLPVPSENTENFSLYSDNAGGAYVIFDYVDGSGQELVYAQRLSSAGSRLWTDTGVAIETPLSGHDRSIYGAAGSNAADGLYVSWSRLDSGFNFEDFYLTRLNANDGSTAFSPLIIDSGNTTDEGNTQLGVDSNNNAMFLYTKTGNLALASSRISPSGTVTPGPVIQSGQEDYDFTAYFYAIMASDGQDGYFITYLGINSSDETELRARRILSGLTLDSNWQVNNAGDLTGIQLANNIQGIENMNIVGDGSQGAYFVWDQFVGAGKEGAYDIYGQYVGSDGQKNWGGGDGVGLSDTGDDVDQFLTYEGNVAISDNNGGFIYTYFDENWESQIGPSVFAQRVANDIDNYENLWPIASPDTVGYDLGGLTSGRDRKPVLVSDGAVGAAVFWIGYDENTEYYDLYGQYLTGQEEAGGGGECLAGPGQTCGEITIGCNLGGTISISNITPEATFEPRSTNFYQDPTNAPLDSNIQVDITDTRGYGSCGDASTLSIQSTGLVLGSSTLGLSLGTALTQGNITCPGDNCVPDSAHLSDVATTPGTTGSIATGADVLNLSEGFDGTIRLQFSSNNLEVVKPSSPISKGDYVGDIIFTLI